MGEDKGRRRGRLAHGGEHPGHEPAQAVGAGEVGEPRRGEALDHPGRHPRHGPAPNAAHPGAGEHHQHHEHPSQGGAPEGDAGKGEDQNPRGDSQGRHVPAVKSAGGTGLPVAGEALEKVCPPPEEIGAAGPQKGLRHVEGRRVGQRPLHQHQGHPGEQQRQKSRRRGKEGMAVHPAKFREGPADGRHRQQGPHVPDGDVGRRGQQVAQAGPQHRRPHALPGHAGGKGHPKGGKFSKHQAPGAEHPPEKAGDLRQDLASVGGGKGLLHLGTNLPDSCLFHRSHRLSLKIMETALCGL